MSQEILNALKTRLTTTSALTAVVGQRIFLDAGTANAPFPLLVYRATDTRVEKFMSAVRHTMDFEFVFYFPNTGTQDIHAAASALGSALSTPLSVTGFDRASFVRQQSGVPSFSDDSWSITEVYRATAFDT